MVCGGRWRGSWCSTSHSLGSLGAWVSWNTANDVVLAEGRRVLINDKARFDGVAVLGVDERVWRHTSKGEVLDPFNVVRLAGDALDQCRRRIQQTLHGHRGRARDPLYRARRTLHTGAGLLTARQKTRLEALFAGDDHVEVEATWSVYQQMIAAYVNPTNPRARRS